MMTNHFSGPSSEIGPVCLSFSMPGQILLNYISFKVGIWHAG